MISLHDIHVLVIHGVVTDSVCDVDKELALKHLKETLLYPVWHAKKKPHQTSNIILIFNFLIFGFPSHPHFTKQQMFYYSAPQAIVTCVLSVTKGFCLKRLDLSHVFACETAVHLGHILGCVKMCNFQVFVLALFESCVTAANRRKKLSCLCICKHHRAMGSRQTF